MSPLLFNLYVSDFSTSNNTEIALYADDSNIYSSSTDFETVTKNIQDPKMGRKMENKTEPSRKHSSSLH